MENFKKKKIQEFIEYWKDKGHEKQEAQKFWIELLSDVLGVEDATKRCEFEKSVKIEEEDGKEHFRYIDIYIPETKVLIEQKDSKLSLDKAYPMSGSSRKFTPFKQAAYYARHLDQKEVPKYIIACNFKEIEIHDNNNHNAEPIKIKVENLEKDYDRLNLIAWP